MDGHGKSSRDDDDERNTCCGAYMFAHSAGLTLSLLIDEGLLGLTLAGGHCGLCAEDTIMHGWGRWVMFDVAKREREFCILRASRRLCPFGFVVRVK
jgi:hypothetical protein